MKWFLIRTQSSTKFAKENSNLNIYREEKGKKIGRTIQSDLSEYITKSNSG